MAAHLTAKQEAFALTYLETGNASEAYRRCYDAGRMKDETVWRKAKELMDNGKVAARLDELRAPIRERAGLTLELHLKRLADLSAKAEELGYISAAVSAEIARGKASGLCVERIEGAAGGSLAAEIVIGPEVLDAMRSLLARL